MRKAHIVTESKDPYPRTNLQSTLRRLLRNCFFLTSVHP